MLFTESDLRMNGNPMAVLDEATYLDEDEAIIRPQTIPVAENTRIGAYTVRFDDVHRLAESHGASYIDAVVAIAESSGVDPASLKVADDEAEIICNPDIVLALPENGVVVAPLSENSLAFQYVTECLSLWDQMPDTDEADMALAEALIEDSYLEQFLNEEEGRHADPNDTLWNNIKGAAAGAWNKVKQAPGAVADFYTRDFRNAKSNWEDRKDSAEYLEKNPNVSDATKKFHQKRVAGFGKDAAISAAKGVGKIAATAAAVGAAGFGLKKFYNYVTQADHKPASWISQKIAALRSLYYSWMKKAQKGGPGVGAKIKQAAAKLLSIIDALMKKLQHATA